MSEVQTVNVARLIIFIHDLVLDWGLILNKAIVAGLGGKSTEHKSYVLLYSKNYVGVQDGAAPALKKALGDSNCLFYDSGAPHEVALNLIKMIIEEEVQWKMLSWDRTEELTSLPEGFSFEQQFENIQQRVVEQLLRYGPKTKKAGFEIRLCHKGNSGTQNSGAIPF
jgi:hypothetical protein